MKRIAPVMLAACLLASPVVAMDIDAVKAHQPPAADSAQEAQVCTATFAAFAFAAEDAESDDAKRDVILTRMWGGIAAEKTGVDYDTYIDSNMMADILALSHTDGETLDFYLNYCLSASRRVIEEAHK